MPKCGPGDFATRKKWGKWGKSSNKSEEQTLKELEARVKALEEALVEIMLLGKPEESKRGKDE